MPMRRLYDAEARRDAGRFLLPRLLMLWAATSVLLYAIAIFPGMPYHVRDLFGPHPGVIKAILFALVGLIGFGVPAFLGLQLVRLPAKFAPLFPLGLLVHAGLVFLGFRYLAPIASAQDMLGAPVWGIGADMERMVRFVALFLVLSVPVSGGTALAFAITRSYSPRRFLWWFVFAGVLLAFSYWVVVANAATDNVTVLLRGEPGLLAGLVLVTWLAAVAFAASLVAERAAGVFSGTVATGFAAILFLLLTYPMLFLALEPRIGGPGDSLSALQFLLSPSRSSYYATPMELFSRYAVVYTGLVALLALAQYPIWLGYSTRRFFPARG